MERIRRSVIAGSWYPGDPKTLTGTVRKYMDKAAPGDFEGKLLGLVAPHAGYIYSGWVAGYAYKLLEKKHFKRVVVIAPSHHAYFKGVSVYTEGGYETPLGIVPLDMELIKELMDKSPLVKPVPELHAKEHALEIQLPFLQVALNQDFLLTPLIMGIQTYEAAEELAQALYESCKGKDVLIVASSDLSHYHSDSDARKLDGAIINRIESFDAKGFHEDIKRGIAEACGAAPIIATMLACRKLGATKSRVLKYATSGDVTGDRTAVVGYLSAAFFDNPGQSRKAGIDLGLSEEEKKILKQLAFETIKAKLGNKDVPTVPNPTPKLMEKRGAFVTLHKDGKLRGCIGFVEGQKPLWETVRAMAIQAAFQDPRFPPLRTEEFDALALEISVLTPPEPLKDLSELEIGRHGLIIRQGYRSGLLLPQVATEHNLNRESFLEWTCLKAGLPPDAWKSPTTHIYIFSADIF